MARLTIDNVTKTFGDFDAVKDVTLEVENGEFLAVLGPSGCGKTTMLRLIAGFEQASAGRITIGDREVAGPGGHVPPEKRRVGIVFQNYALWPHMTVAEEQPGDIDWLAAFVARAFERRASWATGGHWLAVNLPHRLPAAIRVPRLGRDKIAGTSDVVEEEGDRTVLVVPRGRPHASQPGDDNDLLDAGHVCVTRLGWRATAPLDDELLAALAP